NLDLVTRNLDQEQLRRLQQNISSTRAGAGAHEDDRSSHSGSLGEDRTKDHSATSLSFGGLQQQPQGGASASAISSPSGADMNAVNLLNQEDDSLSRSNELLQMNEETLNSAGVLEPDRRSSNNSTSDIGGAGAQNLTPNNATLTSVNGGTVGGMVAGTTTGGVPSGDASTLNRVARPEGSMIAESQSLSML
ncbi:unnamed protein product, partial [Amoebophrya sp. A120]